MWMLHCRTLNNRNSNIHERVLRLRYEGKESSINEFLEKDLSLTVDQKNLQVLNTDIFKVKNDLAHDIIKDVSKLKESPYKLRSSSNHLTRRNFNATVYLLYLVLSI